MMVLCTILAFLATGSLSTLSGELVLLLLSIFFMIFEIIDTRLFQVHSSSQPHIACKMLGRIVNTARVAGRRTFRSSTRVLAEEAAAGEEATKVTLNFAVPHEKIYSETESKTQLKNTTTSPLINEIIPFQYQYIKLQH